MQPGAETVSKWLTDAEQDVAVRELNGCFYCSGPKGRNPECPEHGDHAQLVADNARLRALIKDAEWSGDRGLAYPVCPWCGGEKGIADHLVKCPAFTVAGEVK